MASTISINKNDNYLFIYDFKIFYADLFCTSTEMKCLCGTGMQWKYDISILSLPNTFGYFVGISVISDDAWTEFKFSLNG